MDLEYLPLLEAQRDLYRLPRGMERFREYLETLIDKNADDIKVPLSNLNPMGKDHVPAFVEALIAIDADGAASMAVDRASAEFASRPAPLTPVRPDGETGPFRVCLVATDDLLGGWTNRFAVELAQIRDQRPMHKRRWIAVPLWTSETYGPAKIGGETLAAIHRCAMVGRRGYPEALGDILAQESAVQAAVSRTMAPDAGPIKGRQNAGGEESGMDAREAAYTREVLRPLLGARDVPTLIAALFGDEAAKQLGHAPLGLSERAGLRLARSKPTEP